MSKSSKNKKNKVVDVVDSEEETQAEEKIKDDFKETLLAAIAKMSPKKFEAFSRALLNRMGVEFTEKGVQIMREAGYVARLTDVLAVSVPDQPGGLANVLTLLNAADVSVEYLYSFVRNTGHNAMVIFRLSDNNRGARVLEEGDITLLSQEEVRSL